MKIRAAILLFIPLLFPVDAYSEIPPDYRATYNIDMYGSTIGRSTISLSQTKSEIHYSQNVELVGLISLFKKDRVAENSWIDKTDGALLFKKYQYIQSNSSKNRDSLYEANWVKDEADQLTAEITGNSRGEPVELMTNDTIWDTFSFLLALMSDASHNSETYQYNVISRDEIKQYTFTLTGEETIETDYKKYKTIGLERRSDDKLTKIWLATDLHYVPVLIKQYEDDELDSTMTIDTLTFNEAVESENDQ